VGLSAGLAGLTTSGRARVAVAWAMAQGALTASGADVAVALTGIAGPAGGSDRKPVGTVVFARADKHADPREIIADTKKFDDNGRGGVRLQAALCALELLLPDAPAP
jgi:nicotinamide-nucleotide amidase